MDSTLGGGHTFSSAQRAATYLESALGSPAHRVRSHGAAMAHELRTRARSSGRAAVERRTAFIGPTSPASERVPPRMWCTVNHLGMMTYSGRKQTPPPTISEVPLSQRHSQKPGAAPTPPQPIQCHSVVGCIQEVPPTTKSATIGRRAPETRLVSSGTSSHRDRPSAAAMEFAAQRGSR